MTYLLDTNVCIKLLNGDNHRVTQKLAQQQPENIYISTITQLELFYGAYRGNKTQKNLPKLSRFFSQFTLLSFDPPAAKIAGRIRANLHRNGTPIGGYDLQIAAIALAYELIVVTHNTREFGRVEGLVYEDWELES
ncbi:type II toxin-antitoxin system tRNA(fMet)-specific endonuclease VapC [Sphaerothrix gracilis]|uniref:type II toxin-antitoxin system tRNA(fMet)-specific endonuclease VapC n=1 Tax=Sphaerothrix gracilis TaxID=3151835 RepID=UPI0031FCDBF0